MKKKWTAVICVAVAVALTAGLLAVLAPKTSAGSLPFRAGYAQIDIHPTQTYTDSNGVTTTVALAGYGNTTERQADYSLSEDYDMLKGTVIALADENDNKVVLIAFDGIRVEEVLPAAVRNQVCKETGIPAENIIINASHTHSAVDYTCGMTVCYKYANFLVEQLAAAAVEAVNDLAPVTKMSQGSTEVRQLQSDGTYKYANFTRHYLYKRISDGVICHADDQNTRDADGNKYRTSTKLYEYVGHATDADPTLYVVQFEREGRNPILLLNWRAHPHTQGGISDLRVTGDYVSTWRYYLEQEGYDVSFYQGAAGMTNAHSWYSSEQIVSSFKDRAAAAAAGRDNGLQVLGKFLTQQTVDCINNNLTEVETGDITVKQENLKSEQIISTDEQYENATKIVAMMNDTTTYTDLSQRKNAAELEGLKVGIRSIYYAKSLVARHSRNQYANLNLTTVAVGDAFCIATDPNELFHQNSIWYEQQVAASGKYKMALTFAYTNDSMAYLPSRDVWEYTSYETDVTHFVEGTGEAVVAKACDMLGISYETN